MEQTKRPISTGAEKWIGEQIKCLDHGFVRLVDYMGNDSAVVQAARVSYGAGTKTLSADRGLIRYMKRHIHTSPFEMVEFKFHCRMPIFVARQWIRHRTANVNEYSLRFSEAINEFYMPAPEVIKRQSVTNKQGREELLDPDQQAVVLNILKGVYGHSIGSYQELRDIDLARELARLGISLANYTEWYWKIDLHNLMHFLRLRLDSHAQYEIRVYAVAMAQIVKDAMPLSYEAFEDYQLNAMALSGPEQELISANQWPKLKEEAFNLAMKRFESKREAEEFIEKLEKLRFIVQP